MARRSGVQNFVKNFSAVYGAANELGREFELKGISGQKEFLDEEDNPLTGLARDNAKVQAMADVYSKYGDPEKGLKLVSDNYSNQLSKSKNRVQLETADAQIEAGNLAPREAQARIGASQASASASGMQAKKTGFELKLMEDQLAQGVAVNDAYAAVLKEKGIPLGSKEASSELSKLVMASDMPIATKLDISERVMAVGAQNYTNMLTIVQAEAMQAAQGGIPSLIAWRDKNDDGSKTKLVQEQQNGKFVLNQYATNEDGTLGKRVATLLDGSSEQELHAAIYAQAKNPLNFGGILDSRLDREAKEAEIRATEQSILESKENVSSSQAKTALDKSLGAARVKEINNSIDDVLFKQRQGVMNGMVTRELNRQETKLVREKIKTASLERKVGMKVADKEKQFMRESAQFISDYLITEGEEGLDKAYKVFKDTWQPKKFRVIR